MAQQLKVGLKAGLCLLCTLLFTALVHASIPTPIVATPSDWAQLAPSQKQLLAPLASRWEALSVVQKRKWLNIADKYTKMAPAQQEKLRTRVDEWAKLSEEDRKVAREKYKQLKSKTPEQRRKLKKKWEEYNALSPEAKEKLKQKAAAKRAAAQASGGTNPSHKPEAQKVHKTPDPAVQSPKSSTPAKTLGTASTSSQSDH